MRRGGDTDDELVVAKRWVHHSHTEPAFFLQRFEALELARGQTSHRHGTEGFLGQQSEGEALGQQCFAGTRRTIENDLAETGARRQERLEGDRRWSEMEGP